MTWLCTKIFYVFIGLIYWVIAVAFSVFYGRNAVQIFAPLSSTQDSELDRQMKQRSWRFHQCWFNFVGSIVGWICLWVLGTKLLPCLLNLSYPKEFTWGDAGLALVAFLGVTGYIPYTAFNLANAISALVGKIPGAGKE